ncbi:GNAT family N-acetyltransferase [Herbiconiux solani]|uniref:GNAT family N-acetyltransferase n=1 Tax=Herbiconiux solani TaxID=661329 RepID=UPI0008244BBB|nr:GNAT family N-acetyltransferase [Herbiconiux solani]
MTLLPDARTTRLVEKAEAEYFRRFLARVPERTERDLGIRTEEIGGGVVTAMRDDPSGYWTKALGFGPGDPVDADLIGEIVEVFRSSGKEEGTITIAPSALPRDWDETSRRFGLTPSSAWAKFARSTTAFAEHPEPPADLEVRTLVADDAPAWQHIVREAFGMAEPDLTPMLRSAITDPVARVIGVWDGDLLVGAGAVHLIGEAASLNTGGTLPSHRRRGIQRTLVAARVQAAADAGCRVVSAETSASPDDASHRNLRRAGFAHLYDRTNWTWRA